MLLTLALDLPSAKANLALVEQLATYDIWLKVGFRSYVRDGKGFLQDIKSINPNFKIFLDLKLYDIPNTMADTAEEIAQLGVDMFNVHASSGIKAMQSVMNRLENYEKAPLVLAVTALTSFDNASFSQIYGADIQTRALEFAKMSHNAGLNGVVCSAFESKMIKEATNRDFLTLCPAIRPFGEDSGDQQRVATLEIAKNELVDFPVIGRPIYKDENPKEKVAKILKIINA